ncbi:hypothetical protein [Shigella phage ESh20]|nr:hypothetical protein [Shigella phage ESh20]
MQVGSCRKPAPPSPLTPPFLPKVKIKICRELKNNS